ncbi:MAG TPA: hypothetical protein VGL72_27865 [Bryobacteraceae bacterium]|jgi:hypothetical protein
MKPLRNGVYVLALLCLAQQAQKIWAQVPATASRPAGPFPYDSTQEITLTGTVSKVLPQASVGMVPGAHLLIITSSSSIDISLGTFGLSGKGALSVEPGQQVQAIGVAKTFKAGQVFLARTVTVGNQVYAIRNEHGILVSPQARVRASEKNAQKNSSGNSL